MNVRKVTNDCRVQQWMTIIKECRDSGMSIRAWCKEQGVNEKSFHYWQRKFRKTACEMADAESESLVPSGWARLAAPDPNDSTLTIEVSGCRITVTRDTDPSLVTQTLRMLKSL